MRTWELNRYRLLLPVAGVLRFALLPILCGAAVVIGTLYGSTAIPQSEVLQILLARLDLHVGVSTWAAQDAAIVWDIRVPEVMAAALVGGALATAGTLFQAVLRNPLADPYVIGTSAGAQLGVTVALIVSIQSQAAGFGALQVCAFLGALGTVLLVYALARGRAGTPVVTLLLSGFVVSSFLISATSLLLDIDGQFTQVQRWTLGGIELNTPSQVWLAVPVVLLGCLGAFTIAGRLDVLALGEDQAQHLGLNVERIKLAAIILASLLTAIAVTLAGVVAFVGLVVPHSIRLLFGPRHRTLLPNAAFGGAAFVVAADLVARVAIAPSALPLGVVTAVIGAPFFLYLLRRNKRVYRI